MDFHLSATEIALVLAGALAASAYALLVLVPAWQCYGRLWEKVAASFLTLFMLATLLGIGAGIGFIIVWTYDQYGS